MTATGASSKHVANSLMSVREEGILRTVLTQFLQCCMRCVQPPSARFGLEAWVREYVLRSCPMPCMRGPSHGANQHAETCGGVSISGFTTRDREKHLPSPMQSVDVLFIEKMETSPATTVKPPQ